jgi:hypothetical protein
VLALASPASAVTPVPVRSTPAHDFWVAAAPGLLVYSTAPLGSFRKTILYADPEPGDRERVNAPGTFGHHPSIDLDNPALGDVVAFSQSGSARAPHDIVFYDLETGTPSDPPSGVNTSKSEEAPLILGDRLVFGRGPADGFLKRLIIVDLTTGAAEVLDEAYYIYPGGIEGDWLTWERCERVCKVVRYQVSTEEREYVEKPNRRTIPYSPVIDAFGRVSYLASGADCGEHVRLWREAGSPGSLEMRYRFRDGLDAWLHDVEDEGGSPQIFFARTRCASGDDDIFRIEG